MLICRPKFKITYRKTKKWQKLMMSTAVFLLTAEHQLLLIINHTVLSGF